MDFSKLLHSSPVWGSNPERIGAISTIEKLGICAEFCRTVATLSPGRAYAVDAVTQDYRQDIPLRVVAKKPRRFTRQFMPTVPAGFRARLDEVGAKSLGRTSPGNMLDSWYFVLRQLKSCRSC